jgi:hypothetical protein
MVAVASGFRQAKAARRRWQGDFRQEVEGEMCYLGVLLGSCTGGQILLFYYPLTSIGRMMRVDDFLTLYSSQVKWMVEVGYSLSKIKAGKPVHLGFWG